MGGGQDPTHVVDPDGVEWRITRTWTDWSPRDAWTRSRKRGKAMIDAPNGWGDWFSAFDSTDLWAGLAVVGAILAAALIVIPILLFGLELILVGIVLAIGLMARITLGRPWTIEARTVNLEPPRVLEWQVAGWHRSARLLAQIAAQISKGSNATLELGALSSPG